MFTLRPNRGAHVRTAARRAAARLRWLAAALAAITCASLVPAASASAAPVTIPIPPGSPAVRVPPGLAPGDPIPGLTDVPGEDYDPLTLVRPAP